jgi:hypothetical protein
MALTQPLKIFDIAAHGVRPMSRNNVIPFPSPRVLLPVTLPLESKGCAKAQLGTLLRSPLGVYVASTEVVRDEIRVQFDIAPEDLDFTMHMLITTLGDATIGPIARRRTR